MSDQQSGTGDDRLGEILRSAVPEGPDPIGRADQVVRRGRATNRRRGAATVLAVGAVALAVVIGPRVVDAGPTQADQAGPGPTSGTPTSDRLAHPYTCPTHSAEDRPATVPSTDAVPPGAVLARVCPLSGQRFRPWAPPAEALTTHVESVVKAYNYLPNAEPLSCPPRPGPTTGFSVTFQYPNGHLVRVRADTVGYGSCDFISIDGRDELGRSRSEVVMLAYFAALQRQSPTEVPPPGVTRDPLSCPKDAGKAEQRPLVGTRLDLANVTLCRYPGLAHRHSASLVLTPSQVSLVNEAYSRMMPGRFDVDCALGPSDPTYLIGSDDWGNRVWMLLGCLGFQAANHYWSPGRGVQAIIGSL